MSAMALRIIAALSMLLDHIGCLFGIYEFRIIGRIAFPLYLFLLYNGYRHTSNKLLYAVRLGVFALFSQIPFSLFITGNSAFTANGNVFFTLLICLICIWITDAMLRNKIAKWICFIPTVAVFALYYFNLISTDNGENGILLAFVFVAFYGKGKGFMRKLITSFGMLCVIFHSYIIKWILFLFDFVTGQKTAVPTMSDWQMLQIFALVSLVFIFLYNNKRGKWPLGKANSRVVQYGFYAFYPIHLLVLWTIKVVLNALM